MPVQAWIAGWSPLKVLGVCGLLSLAVVAPASAEPRSGFATDGAGSIAQLTIGAGQTLSFNGSVASQSSPGDEAVTPNGRYLYAVIDGINGAGAVDQYRIGSDGTLHPLTPASAAVGDGPVQVALSPDGKNAYVASYGGNSGASSLSEYSIAGNGALRLIGTVTSGLQFAEGVAVSPSGSSVYVANVGAGKIFEYARARDGLLTLKSPASVPYSAGALPDPGFTPNGRYLYVSGVSQEIDEYSAGSGGQLKPLPVPSIASGQDHGLAVSPGGHSVYASSCTKHLGSGVYQYTVGAHGELTPLSPAFLTTDGCGLPWMTASGSSFYSPDGNQSIYQFSVSGTGALSPRSPPAVTNPAASGLYAFVIPPDQSPVAKFSVKTGRAGKASKFNAKKSYAPDGKLVRYVWKFGPHSTKTTTKPTVRHTFKKAGKYKVRLTVTDDSGCSTTQVFTGQTAYCNGTKAAMTRRTVKIKRRKR